jgi:hypothetical protein
MLTSDWRKSTASDSGSGCLEARWVGGMVQVRDTKQGGRGPILTFTPLEWWAVKVGMSRGEFDLPGWHKELPISSPPAP